MREHPILMSSPMVRAILEGRKTMTRRVVKMAEGYAGVMKCFYSSTGFAYSAKDDGNCSCIEVPCHYCAGDRLWVKETFTATKERDVILYREDSLFRDMPKGDLTRDWNWTPSILMPRWASRITLEITEVRAERLREITEADAKAEGTIPSIVGGDLDYLRYRAGFQTLWESINGKKNPWESNLWVWVVSFRKVTP